MLLQGHPLAAKPELLRERKQLAARLEAAQKIYDARQQELASADPGIDATAEQEAKKIAASFKVWVATNIDQYKGALAATLSKEEMDMLNLFCLAKKKRHAGADLDLNTKENQATYYKYVGEGGS